MAGKKNANETLTPEELEKARRSGAGGRQMRGVKVKVDNAGEIFKRLMTYVARRYKFHLIRITHRCFPLYCESHAFMRSVLLRPMHTRGSWSLSLRGLCAISARRCLSIWRAFRSDISTPTATAT